MRSDTRTQLARSLAWLSRQLDLLANRVAASDADEPTPMVVPRGWPSSVPSPWAPLELAELAAVARCNICRWHGDRFEGGAHSESAVCPQCGSIARDRFLFYCLVSRTPDLCGVRLLETSPRIRGAYPEVMGRWFDYTSSDYDESAHSGMLQIDLQETSLPTGAFDVILSPHVLEHVPDTDRALSELRRIIAPGGRLILQVPLLQGRTAPPSIPEFHGDHTPVFWRFGFDLAETLRTAGFVTSLLCTEQFARIASSGEGSWPEGVSPEFDVTDMLANVIADDLLVVADDGLASQLGFQPDYMFLTWECVVPI